MAFAELFVGVPQSKLAGMAILFSIFVVGVLIIFSKDDIPMAKKFTIVFMLFLLALPSVLLSLFQLTCIVTGNSGTRWCGIYAWVISLLVVLYSVMLVVMSVISMVADKKVKETFLQKEEKELANAIAGDLFTGGSTTTPTTNTPTAIALNPSTTTKEDKESEINKPSMNEPFGNMEDGDDDKEHDGAYPTSMVPQSMPVDPAAIETFSTCGAPF